MKNVAENPAMEATRAFFDSRIAVLGLIGLLAVMFVAIFAPWIAPQDPYDLMQLNFMDGKLPPGSRGSNGELFLLGSDDQGRDILSAILYGLRTSLAVGAASAGIAFVLGSVVGLFAAYAGGWIDALVMRFVELQLSLPAILIALVLVAILGQGTDKIIIALEATLSFLGIGLPLTEPSLGLLISNGYADMLSGRYWLSFYPGLALLFTIVSINLVGDQLRDVLNPKARQQ